MALKMNKISKSGFASFVDAETLFFYAEVHHKIFEEFCFSVKIIVKVINKMGIAFT